MSKWLLSIVGVSFLAVLLDIIYPNGKTNAFCKSIFGIMTVCIMMSPLLNFKTKNFKIDLFNSEVAETLNDSKNVVLENQITNLLLSKGINNVCVEIENNLSDNDYEIENVYVDTSEIVLSENMKNINKYEVISQSVLEVLDIEKERIIIYG